MPHSPHRGPEKDILKLLPAKPASPPTSRRIGIHCSTSGGVETAAERAWRLGCNALQMFSSSPRQWAPYNLGRQQCEVMSTLRNQYDLKPLVIHANYLINVAGVNSDFRTKSIAAFRGEVERALALCAEYLVLHPGSFRGMTRDEGLANASSAIEEAVRGLDLAKGGLTLLIENTAGAEFSLGSKFDQVAELCDRLRFHMPVAACIDTCHTWVAGYDIVSASGYEETMKLLDNTVGLKNVVVWHCNDAKAAFGSKLDRHQHIGEGTIGLEAFRRLLNDPRTAHAAFLAETPVDAPLDDLKNVNALKSLVAVPAAKKTARKTSNTELKRKRSRRI
ncbi:MAG TPA: deoxyribonuclease IV [Terriglobales bacterium]